MRNSPFKVAMLGGGINSSVGRTHEIAMRIDHDFDLVAGCFSRNAEINALTAEAYGVSRERVYGSVQELLNAEAGRIDVVVIATPMAAHAEQISMALEAGLVVICEKPLVANSDEFKMLFSKAPLDGVKLFSIFNYTGYQAVREIKNRIASGEIGRVFKIMAEMPQDSYLRLKNVGNVGDIQSWRLSDAKVPCVSLDLFVHIHSLVNFITGLNPVSVVARSRSISEVGNDLVDEVDTLIEYENDLLLNAWYGKVALGYRNGLKIRIFGTQGSFEWVQENPENIGYADSVGNRYLIDRITSSSSVTPQGRYNRFKAGHPAGFIEAFANYYADIARAMRDGALNEYTLSLAVAAQGVALSSAIHEASVSRRVISLR